MRSSRRRILSGWVALVFLTLYSGIAQAQDITPVDVDTKKPEQPRLHYYDKHGNRLDEPVYFITENDTVKSVRPASPWPLFNGVTAGFNFFDAILLIAGQSYASFNLEAAVSLHNWFFPTIEAGLGYSNLREEGSEMRYKTKPSPFIKLGLDYNFLYKGTPDYMAGVGLRFGWARPAYSITGATLSAPYWGQQATLDITGQEVNAWFGEALATVKVKIWKALSLGWSIRYRFKLKIPDASQSTPWFIPGYGGSSPLTATFSVMYTFGRKNSLPPEQED